jgi:superfamily II DNA or RNA helicase
MPDSNIITFRPYQEAAIQSARDRIARGVRRILLNSPTGSGKTVIAGGIVQRAVAKGRRVLFLAHRRELIDQTVNKLRDAGVHDFGVIMAGSGMINPDAPVQVASIQTLIRREFPRADLVIIDECHRAASRSYLSVLANYPDAAVIGLSATPERLDGKGLDNIFSDMVAVATVPDLIEAGHLVKPVCYAGETADLSGVKIRRGDYDEHELASAMDKPKLTGDIVTNWLRIAKGRQTAVFAAGVEHAQHLTAEFFAAGIPAATVTGATPRAEREAIIADWRAGFVQVVVNVFVFVEGFDMPSMECVVLARPTKSVSLYLQAVGRVMRPFPGKDRAILIDHAGCWQMHGPPHIHREWALEGLAKSRKEPAAQVVCASCGIVYEAKPRLWLEETQPGIHPKYARDAAAVAGGSMAARGLDVCPGCAQASCRVCLAPFKAKTERRDIDGIAWDSAATCVTCGAVYADSPHLISQAESQAIPETTQDDLVEMGDHVPVNVVVTNEYKRLLNEAKAHGRKRGWVYWRLKDRWDEDTLKECLPRHTGKWWKAQA